MSNETTYSAKVEMIGAEGKMFHFNAWRYEYEGHEVVELALRQEGERVAIIITPRVAELIAACIPERE